MDEKEEGEVRNFYLLTLEIIKIQGKQVCVSCNHERTTDNMCGPSPIPKHGTNIFEVSSDYALDEIRYICTNQSVKRKF